MADEAAAPASPLRSKFALLRQALLQGKKGIKGYRRDFLDACIAHADALRVRARPQQDDFPKRVLEDCGKLKVVRDAIVDWVILEAEETEGDIFSDLLVELLEGLRELKSRPSEVNSWNDIWFEAHRFFVYETFLYIVAALIKQRAFQHINTVFTGHYTLPASERHGDAKFDTFDGFYAYAGILGKALAESDQNFNSPAVELIKRQAQRSDSAFNELIQADLLCFLMACINPEAEWFPQILYYAEWGENLPLFLKAIQKRHFKHLAVITGIPTGDGLRSAIEQGRTRHNLLDHRFRQDVWKLVHANEWDTL